MLLTSAVVVLGTNIYIDIHLNMFSFDIVFHCHYLSVCIHMRLPSELSHIHIQGSI